MPRKISTIHMRQRITLATRHQVTSRPQRSFPISKWSQVVRAQENTMMRIQENKAIITRNYAPTVHLKGEMGVAYTMQNDSSDAFDTRSQSSSSTTAGRSRLVDFVFVLTVKAGTGRGRLSRVRSPGSITSRWGS